MRRAWTEDLRFSSNVGKKERERWVVGTFLSNLPLSFDPSELRSPPQRSKVDVEFRDARFHNDLVRDEASQLAASRTYAAHKSSLDLLFYVTSTRASSISAEVADSTELATLGRRSVSCLMGDRALVLQADSSAPLFLRVSCSGS